MPIPDLLPIGVLPPSADGGGYRCTPAEVAERFVEPFPTSSTRVRLFDGWDVLRSTIDILVPGTVHWLYGPFVTAFLEPDRLQTVIVMPGRVVDALDARQFELLDAVLHWDSALDRHGCDIATIYQYPGGDAGAAFSDAQVAKYLPRCRRNRFDQDGELVDAGFLEVLTTADFA